MVWPQIAAAALSVAGGISSGRAERRARRAAQQAAMKSQAAKGRLITPYMRKLYENLESGYGQARGLLQGQGYAARQTALDREQQSKASAQSGLFGSGYYGSNLYDNAMRGITSDTTRSLQAIDTQVAGMLSQLELGFTTSQGALIEKELGLRQQQQQEWIDIQGAPAGLGLYGSGVSPGGTSGGVDWGAIGAGIGQLGDLDWSWLTGKKPEK